MNVNPLGIARRVGLPLLAVAIVAALGSTAAACPSCKAALSAQEGQGDLVSGFFWSILFMMSMPFAIVTSFSGYMYLLVRRARAAAGAAVVGSGDAPDGGSTGD